MNKSKSKTVSLVICKNCEEELRQEQKNDASLCSCAQCNSLDCFTLRNKRPCSCKPTNDKPTLMSRDKVKNIDKDISSAIGCKASKMHDSDSVHKERIKKEITYEYSNNNGPTVKKHSRYSCSGLDPREKVYEDMSTEKLVHTHSATVVFLNNDIESNTAKLSAQIMDVPYNEFKESISCHATQFPLVRPKLSKFDILKRIKEAYKACSCKVCECIIGKSQPIRNTFCKCKPCQCNDCAAFLKTIETKQCTKQFFIGNPCIKYDRPQFKGVTSKADASLEYCGCDPCDCLRCFDSYTKPCDCKPCECIKCKSVVVKPILNKFVVSTMREDVPARSYCQCSPCDCAECGQDYPMSSSLRHEMATGISRPPNCACDNCASMSCEAHDGNACTCEIKKRVMRKPFEKDTRDYDIHIASVRSERKTKKETIAMFAEVPNIYPSHETSNKHACSCGDCECIICSCKDNTNISVNRFSPQKPSYMLNKACKCMPCECAICNTNIDDKECKSEQSLPKHDCKCDTCDCLNCVNISIPTSSHAKDCTTALNMQNVTKNICKCSPCECLDCQKMMSKCTGDSCYCTKCKCLMYQDHDTFIHETVYRNRTGCLPVSSNYKIKFNDNYISNTKKTSNFMTTPIKLAPQKDVPAKIAFPKFEDYRLDDNPVRDVNHNKNVSKSCNVREPILTCEAYVQCKDKNVIMQYCNHQTYDYKSSASCVSEKQSLAKTQLKHFGANTNMQPIQIQRSSYDPSSLHNSNTMFSKFSLSECMNDFLKFDFDDKLISNGKNEMSYKRPIDSSEDIDKFSKGTHNSKLKNSFYVPHPNDEYDQVSISLQISKDCENIEMLQALRKTLNDDTKRAPKINDKNEINCVRDLSVNLVMALRNANERLSTLMAPRVSQHISNLGPSKASISLIRKWINGEENKNNTNIKYNGNLSDMEIDYDKINVMLQQAKAFSEELVKVLNQYKKANEKLESRFQNQTISRKKYEDKYFGEAKPISFEVMCQDNTKSLLFKNESLKTYGCHNLKIDKNGQGKTDIDERDKADVELNLDTNENYPNDVLVLTNRGEKTNFENIVNNWNHISDSIQNNPGTNDLCSVEENEHLLEQISDRPNEERQRYRFDKRNNKRGSRHRVSRTIVLNKRLKLREALLTLASNRTSSATVSSQEAKTHCCQQNDTTFTKGTANNSVLLVNTEKVTTTSVGTGDESEKLQVANGADENMTWSILKKNCMIGSLHTDSRGFSRIPPLQLEIKDTLRAISILQRERDGCDNEVTVTGHRNAISVKKNRCEDITIQSCADLENQTTLKNINSELKDFSVASSQTCRFSISAEKAVDCMDDTFSMVVLKRQIQELLQNKIHLQHPVVKKSLKVIDIENSDGVSSKACTSSRSPSDPLKAKFVSLRKVSDHTVLIKWKVPKDVNSVEGYELLVDGRSVQKIISPARCMAVVTCLPHVDKVLITVRTLVSSAIQCAYYPASTIVYKMR